MDGLDRKTSALLKKHGEEDKPVDKASVVMQNTTLAYLNELSASQNFLIMLRTMNTSDLGFTYMLFKQETLEDIVEVCQSILDIEDTFGFEPLTKEQRTEIVEYMHALDPEPA